MYSFENLDAWQKSKEVVKAIYSQTDTFPSAEKFGLVAQLRRASISVSSNLAEGSARKSAKDKAHFTTMANSSLMELLNQLIIARELGFLEEADYRVLRRKIQEVSYLLSRLWRQQSQGG